MGLLEGRSYGEPVWANTASHSEDDIALRSSVSYEEDRMNRYWVSPAAMIGVVPVPNFAA